MEDAELEPLAAELLSGTDVQKFLRQQNDANRLANLMKEDSVTGLWALNTLGHRATEDLECLKVFVDFWMEIPIARLPFAKVLLTTAYEALTQ